MSKRLYPYPFTAIVGQENLKLGLIIKYDRFKYRWIVSFWRKKELLNLQQLGLWQSCCLRD